MWLSFIVFSVLYTSILHSTYSQGLCQNSQGQAGVCINIRRCSGLLNLLQLYPQNPSVGNYLRSNVCGYEGYDPRVCCPTNQNTVDTGNNNDRDPKEFPSTIYGPLYPPDCGFSNVSLRRIVGGEPALLGAWPWITALGYTNPRDPSATRWLCGGVLISKQHILTAGHCVYERPDLFKIRIGDLDLNSDYDGAFPFEDYIHRRVVHPEYNPVTHTNDVAVLKTTRDVPFTTNLHPICLPVDDYHRNRNLDSTFPFVAGWGSVSFHGPTSSRLMQVQIPVRTEQECKNSFQNLGAVIDRRVLCAGFAQGGKDACQGDSGGPLMAPSPRENKIYYVIGVVSYGYKCAEPGFPGVYTRVTSFLNFITNQLV